MNITLIADSISESKNIKVNFGMIKIALAGVEYYLYTSPTNADRIVVDVYSGDAEETIYNGILPIKR